MSAVSHPPDAALADYTAGLLDPAARTEIAYHLDTCPDCRARLTSLSGGGSGTEEMPAVRVGAPPLPTVPGYRIDRLLGEGGMGEVYLAHNLEMDRPEVLKVVRPALLRTPGALERFQQEIRNAARLQHPNIVTAYSMIRAGDVVAFAMEYVRGRDLAAVVRAKGPLPVALACYYVRQAALGLRHAHENGMIHRDIKPHNLMLARQGKKHVIKILDFGIARATDRAEGTGRSAGQVLGTPDYAAPEQTLDAARADARSDIYSLGCTLYHLLTGRPPFAGATVDEVLEAHRTQRAPAVRDVRPEVPAGLSAVVARMMAKAPADRYQTPAEVVTALSAFVKSAGKGDDLSESRSEFFAGPIAPPSTMAAPVLHPRRGRLLGPLIVVLGLGLLLVASVAIRSTAFTTDVGMFVAAALLIGVGAALTVAARGR